MTSSLTYVEISMVEIRGPIEAEAKSVIGFSCSKLTF